MELEEYLNKIICGDSLEIMKQLPDKCIDLVLTDPPYGMNYQSSWRTATKQFDKIQNDNGIEWFKSFIEESYRILKDDTHIYIFCNDYAISQFREMMENVGFTIKRTLVWVKNNHTSGDLEGDYANKTEFVIFAHKGRRKLNGGRDTNVLMFDRVATMEHPTQKPTDMCKYLIEKSTKEGEIILDPFLGSGTTARACKDMGRNYIGIEISPEYCAIAEKRLKQEVLF